MNTVKNLRLVGLAALGVVATGAAIATEYGTVVLSTPVTAQSAVIGYDVVDEYNGQRYSARLPQDPGARIALDVSVAPAGAAQAGTAPVASLPPPLAVYTEPPVAYGPPVYGVPYQPLPAYGYGYGYSPYGPYGPAAVAVPRLSIGIGGGYRGHWR